jgi:hypothetical protein
MLLSVLVGLAIACGASGQPVATKSLAPATQEPSIVGTRMPTPGPAPSLRERLQRECPLEARDECVETMSALLASTEAQRVALCVDRAGRWLTRDDLEPTAVETLPPDARTGDRCPAAFPYAIIGIYER